MKLMARVRNKSVEDCHFLKVFKIQADKKGTLGEGGRSQYFLKMPKATKRKGPSGLPQGTNKKQGSRDKKSSIALAKNMKLVASIVQGMFPMMDTMVEAANALKKLHKIVGRLAKGSNGKYSTSTLLNAAYTMLSAGTLKQYSARVETENPALVPFGYLMDMAAREQARPSKGIEWDISCLHEVVVSLKEKAPSIEAIRDFCIVAKGRLYDFDSVGNPILVPLLDLSDRMSDEDAEDDQVDEGEEAQIRALMAAMAPKAESKVAKLKRLQGIAKARLAAQSSGSADAMSGRPQPTDSDEEDDDEEGSSEASTFRAAFPGMT